MNIYIFIYISHNIYKRNEWEKSKCLVYNITNNDGVVYNNNIITSYISFFHLFTGTQLFIINYTKMYNGQWLLLI